MRATLAALAVLALALPAAASTDVGLVDPGQGVWHLRDSATGLVTTFTYGNPGDVPFMGDWDCDGVATPGLFRPSDAFAYLRNSNSTGIADIRFFFGDPADVPIGGDFDGDGCDTLSLYRPSEQRFYVINELGRDEGGLGTADFTFDFGNPGDTPFAGDFDGDGRDEVGLHRETTGLVYFEDALVPGGGGGAADHQFVFGDPGDLFVAGDWDGDGRETPALLRGCTFFGKNTSTAGVADFTLGFGEPGFLPVAGDFALSGGAAPMGPCAAAAPPPTAAYTVTFEATWSPATHPVDFPPNPHFSGLVGGTHRAGTGFWAVGGPATAGIEAMAELGAKESLAAEVATAIGAGEAGEVISGGGVAVSPGTATATFTVTVDHPLVTVVSMVAPSPDWFVGVAGLSLLEDGAWVAEKAVALYPYDAGTDSGASYGSADADTVPPEPIARITTPPAGNGTPLGRLVFTRNP